MTYLRSVIFFTRSDLVIMSADTRNSFPVSNHFDYLLSVNVLLLSVIEHLLSANDILLSEFEYLLSANDILLSVFEHLLSANDYSLPRAIFLPCAGAISTVLGTLLDLICEFY